MDPVLAAYLIGWLVAIPAHDSLLRAISSVRHDDSLKPENVSDERRKQIDDDRFHAKLRGERIAP